MVEEAYRLLGLQPDVDTPTIEATYWRTVREISALRRQHPEAEEQLERINWAYKTLIDYRHQHPAAERHAAKRTLPWRKALSYALAATVATIALGLGLTERDQIADQVSRGTEEAKARWDDTITWLQALGQEEETRQPPGEAHTK